ncbi:MAG: penicillin-binding protein 2, partial [Candidatus Omnitrophota bacterium]
MKKKRENLRIHYLYLFFVFFFIILLVRVAYLQIIQKDLFQNLAAEQHFNIVPLKGERGRILDCRNRVLAINLNVYSVFADPELIVDREKTAATLSLYLNMDEQYFLSLLNKKSRFVWLKRKISLDEKINMERLNLDGIGFIKDRLRFYPQVDLLSHILGGVNIDNQGIEGIELFYDNYLRGKDGSVSIVKDSAATSLFFYPQIFESTKGVDVYLTVDAQIQYWVEKFLKETIDQFSASAGGVVVMNPATGAIIALANMPAYDPNCINSTESESLRNRAVTDIFEPGSVFKIVSLVAALDKKLFPLEDVIFCENGAYKIPGTVLHDFRPYGNLTFKEVFKKSSNIGVSKIANAIGKDDLCRYIKVMGFGRETGIDLHGEAKGFLKPVRVWSKTSPYIIPIGQEIGVTLIQLAQAISSIANGGYLVRPYLAEQLKGDYGYSRQTKKQRKRIFSSSVALDAKNILIEVVDDGTGRYAKVGGFTVGGKTGTA